MLIVFHPLVMKRNCQCELKPLDSRHVAAEAPEKRKVKSACHQSRNTSYLISFARFIDGKQWINAPDDSEASRLFAAFVPLTPSIISSHLFQMLWLVLTQLSAHTSALTVTLIVPADGSTWHLDYSKKKRNDSWKQGSRSWCAPRGFQSSHIW